MAYSFGEKLKDLRIKRSLSQDELAEKINDKYGTTINKGMISKWENNLGEPRLETARVLALFFGISLDELLGLKDEVEEQKDITTIAAHKEGEEWTEEELRELERFKEFLKSKRT